MNKLSSRIILATAWCSFVVGSIYANEVKEMPLAKKACAADLIFTGEVVSVDSAMTARDISVGFAIVKVGEVLKSDTTAKEVKVIYAGPIAEFDPDCCKVQSPYLLFVERTQTSLYRSVNGRFGVYRMVEDAVLGWDRSDPSKAVGIAAVEEAVSEMDAASCRRKT